jgi:hypothetical protein
VTKALLAIDLQDDYFPGGKFSGREERGVKVQGVQRRHRKTRRTHIIDNGAHSVDGADEAEANGVESALNDQIAREEEAAARKTEAELLAQAQ